MNTPLHRLYVAKSEFVNNLFVDFLDIAGTASREIKKYSLLCL